MGRRDHVAQYLSEVTTAILKRAIRESARMDVKAIYEMRRAVTKLSESTEPGGISSGEKRDELDPCSIPDEMLCDLERDSTARTVAGDDACIRRVNGLDGCGEVGGELRDG